MPENAPSESPETPTGTEVPAAPLNRAARRKQAKAPVEPGHVGPQSDVTRSGRAPRPHTKRRIG